MNEPDRTRKHFFKSPRMFMLGIPVAALASCAPQCAPAPTEPAAVVVQAPAPAPAETVAQREARKSAADYLKYVGGFSRLGLIDQLLYEGFSKADATYGTDAQGADWNAQAAQSAADYLEHVGGFSHKSLVDQLLYEKFTPAEAEYGVSTTGL